MHSLEQNFGAEIVKVVQAVAERECLACVTVVALGDLKVHRAFPIQPRTLVGAP